MAEHIHRTLTNLGSALLFDQLAPGPASHRVTVVSGLEEDPVPAEIGRFLTALVANAFTADLRLLNHLRVPTERFRLEDDVARIVGVSNDDPTIDKVTERDPWLAEGILHLLFHLGRASAPVCLPRGLLAMSPITPHVKRPGLDVVSIYGDETVAGISLGEAKSTRDDPNGALFEAVEEFREVEEGLYDFEIRSRVSSLTSSLGPEGDALYLVLWRSSFAYVPCVAYEVPNSFTPARNRATLFSKLTVGPQGICLILVQLSNAADFYDSVADSMRTSTTEFTGRS